MKNITTKDGQSADLIGENIAHMKQLFPEAFSENGVDFDVLRQLLGDASVLDEGEEKYGLNPLLFLGVGYGFELPPRMFWCPVNKKNMSVPYGNETKPKVDSYVSYSV